MISRSSYAAIGHDRLTMGNHTLEPELNASVVVYLKMGFQPDLGDAGAPSSPIWLKHLPFGVGADVVALDGRSRQCRGDPRIRHP